MVLGQVSATVSKEHARASRKNNVEIEKRSIGHALHSERAEARVDDTPYDVVVLHACGSAGARWDGVRKTDLPYS